MMVPQGRPIVFLTQRRARWSLDLLAVAARADGVSRATFERAGWICFPSPRATGDRGRLEFQRSAGTTSRLDVKPSGVLPHEQRGSRCHRPVARVA
jgi:hypothetical protein